MSGNNEKRRQLDDEMSRFEAEILSSSAADSAPDTNGRHKKGDGRHGTERHLHTQNSGSSVCPPQFRDGSSKISDLLPPPPPPPALAMHTKPNSSVTNALPPPRRLQPPPGFPGSMRSQDGSEDNRGPHGNSGPQGSNSYMGPLGPPGHLGPHRPNFPPMHGPPDPHGGQRPLRPFGPPRPPGPQGMPNSGPRIPPFPGPHGHPAMHNSSGPHGPGNGSMGVQDSPGVRLPPGVQEPPNRMFGPPPFPVHDHRSPSNFMPPQLMRNQMNSNIGPHGSRPPPPPPPPHLLRQSGAFPPRPNLSGVVAAASPTISKPPVLEGPKVVYASQPTRYTNIIKSTDESSSPDATSTTTASNQSTKRTSDKLTHNKKAKKMKNSNAVEMAEQVMTSITVTVNKKTLAIPNAPAAPVPETQPQTVVTKQSKPKKDKKPKKNLRYAGGAVWEDTTLNEWEPDDFRMFAGDLGNDVTEELLTRTFSCYPSFVKAKVVRDKFTNKSKGYGFLSFKEPGDYTRAMKEMNGRYVGSRPIKLRKSSWRDRSLDVVQKKAKEKTLLGLK